MQHRRNFKSILAAVLAVIMLLAISAPAFAITGRNTELEEISIALVNEENGIAPRAAGILGQINWNEQVYYGYKDYTYTPSKNHYLWVRVNNNYTSSTSLKIEVIQQGVIKPIKTIEIPTGTANTPYLLVSGCNGGRYTLRFSGYPANFFAVVYQLENP